MRVVFLLASVALVSAGIHPRPPLPSGWVDSEVLALPTSPLKFTLVLRENQQGIEQIKRDALELSDPRSGRYGQYLSGDEINKITAPTPEAVAIAADWLSASLPAESIQQLSNRFVVTCSLPQAEALFATSFGLVQNPSTRQVVLRAGDYQLPEEVEVVTAAVFGLHGLPLPPRRQATVSAQPVDVTPSVLTKFYGIAGVTPQSGTANSQAVAEFQGQYMNSSDLTAFFKEFVPTYHAGTDDKVSKFVGDPDKQIGQTEASLDIQYMMGVSVGIKSEFWLYNNMDFCGDLANWTSTILNTKGSPQVHSVSYGWQGDLAQLQCTNDKVTVVDDALAKLAANGKSIIFASGDSGAGYTSQGAGEFKLYPSWPASSPWVTSVGATRFSDQIEGHPEMATDQFGSGGGFSAMFQQEPNAKWQEQDVANYFNLPPPKLPPSTAFNKTGRATPDVSALGEGYQVMQNGAVMAVGGTSASTPVFAGIVGLLNEARIQAGKPAMGFLNPWIYQNQDAFTDVLLGDNAYGRGPFRTPYGYNVTKGWDPATGVGSPIFSKMLAAALK